MYLLLNLFIISYAATFLALYPGAQPTAMGGAFCGIADNAYANFYNPAGLAFQREVDLVFEDNSITGGLSDYTHDAFERWFWNCAGVLPLRENLVAGFLASGVIFDEIIFGAESTETQDTCNPYDLASGLSLGYMVHKSFGTGIAFKYIRSFLWPELFSQGGTVKSFAADIGFLFNTSLLLGKLKVGAAIQNIGPKIYYSFWEEKLPLLLSIKAGISYTINFQKFVKINRKGWFKKWLSENLGATIAYDITAVKYEGPRHSIGVEVRPIPFLAARVGYFSDLSSYEFDTRKGWTAGLGIDFKFIRIDISKDDAFFYYKLNGLRFSFSLNIGEPIFPKHGLLGK
jgi:Type IX secretion system protein PorV